MAGFPERLGEWLTTYDDAPEFSPATDRQIAAFAAEAELPTSIEDLWADYGSCYFAGVATVTGKGLEDVRTLDGEDGFQVFAVHGLDATERGVLHILKAEPALVKAGLVPLVSDIDGNRLVWSMVDGHIYLARPGREEQRVVATSPDALWKRMHVKDYEHADVSMVKPGENYPATDVEPQGLVEEATVTRAWSNAIVFVLDTDQGQPTHEDLDEHGLGATPTCVSVATIDDECEVMLARAEQRRPPRGMRLLWEGEVESPTGEIGTMDSSGLITMFVRADQRERVQIWGDKADEQTRIVAIVG